MSKKLLVLFALLPYLTILGAGVASAQEGSGAAIAELQDGEENLIGTAFYQTVNDQIVLPEAEKSLFDGRGSALLIHAMADDYQTDDDPEAGPGISGERIAADEIVAAESGDLVATGGPNPLLLLAMAVGVLLVLVAGVVALIMRLRRRRT